MQKVAAQITMLVVNGCRLTLFVALSLYCSLTLADMDETTATNEETEIRIEAWLSAADKALAQNHLLTPKGSSAYDYYQQVLAVNSSHPKAHWGMREIGRQYLRLAEAALIAERRPLALQLMSKALSVSASIDSVETLKAKYPVKPEADNSFKINGDDLARQNEVVVKQLASLAVKAQSIPSRLLIVARSDAEGRWIYKIMREAVSGYRLRGNIALGDNPKIVLIDAESGNF